MRKKKFEEDIKPYILKPITKNQGILLQEIRTNVIVMCYGEAGTGKSMLSVGYAAQELLLGHIKKIVLCRPAVENDEKIGFLPGNFSEKLTPYLMPLFDSLNKFMSYKKMREFQEENIIEICAIGYMRGRTFTDSIIIADEAQNATYSQMKMLLTRIGENSKMIINGDITQSDLPKNKQGGFKRCVDKLDGISGIAIVKFDKSDIVRHGIIAEILEKLD